MNQKKRALLVETVIEAKTYDIDVAGHVNNIVYIRWLEDLRFLWLNTHYPYQPRIEAGIAPVILETHAHYSKPLFLFRPIHARIWVEELGRVKYTLGFELECDGQIVFEATQVGAWFMVETGKPIRIQDDLKTIYVKSIGE